MTKAIRIENADTSSYKVVVYTEDLIDGVWTRTAEQRLDYPTAMTHSSTYLTSSRRLVVEEVKE